MTETLYTYRDTVLARHTLLVRHWTRARDKVAAARATLADGATALGDALWRLPHADTDEAAVRRVLAALPRTSSDVVVLGLGGSSLGAQALLGACRQTHEPRFHFPENLDGDTMARLLSKVDWWSATILMISKSGGTTETMAQILVLLDYLKQTGQLTRCLPRMRIVAAPGESPLRRLAAQHDIETLDHDPNLSGRFSMLSTVGLLPAALADIDIAEVRRGAAEVLAAARTEPDAAPVRGAAAMVAAMSAGLAGHVLFSYADRLERLGAWHRQLWAESIGKSGIGLLPTAATGPVDQHSQLQLWLDGPGNLLFTVAGTGSLGTGPTIPETDDPDLAYLGGRKLGDVVDAQRRATTETLIDAKVPLRTLDMNDVTPASFGAVAMHFMIETVLACTAMEVTPFDQPAVEAGKKLTKTYLNQMQHDRA